MAKQKGYTHEDARYRAEQEDVSFSLLRLLFELATMRKRVRQARERGGNDELLEPVEDWLNRVEHSGHRAARYIQEKK